MPKQVILANPRGFCAGVDRAIEIVEQALVAHGAPVYVRHEVVHNKYVVDDLRTKGAVFIEDLESVPSGSTVVFSAHGVSLEVRREAEALGRRALAARLLQLETRATEQVPLLLEMGLHAPALARACASHDSDLVHLVLLSARRAVSAAAFAALRDPLGPFFYQDTYVFVLDRHGTLLLNPAFPALEGRSLLSWPDPAERATAAASLQAVLRDGSTWTTYKWPRPSASNLPERKATYLRRVVAPGGEVLIVGSGLYAGG